MTRGRIDAISLLASPIFAVIGLGLSIASLREAHWESRVTPWVVIAITTAVLATVISMICAFQKGRPVQDLTALLGIAAAIAVGAASPGPSFVFVARQAVSAGRNEALFSALGMGVGGVLFACLALAGLNGLLVAVPSVYLILKIAGGLYLVYLGIRIWRAARAPLEGTAVGINGTAHSKARSFFLAFTTQVSNPKAAVVYASVFAAFLPPAPSLAFNVSVAMVVLLIEVGWYALVALVLSSESPRLLYLRSKAWIDRAAGGVMVALGLKLVFGRSNTLSS